MEVKGLSKKLAKDKIMTDFRGTLLDFCESVIPNGSRRGDESDCSDIFNSERAEDDQGSCSVNLVSGTFYDQNPNATPRKGNAYDLFCAITGLKGVKAYRAIRQWNEDRTLPDGTEGVRSDRKVELSEGSTIEAQDDFEKDRVRWIHTFQDWITYSQENGGTPGKTVQYGITRFNARLWVLANKFTYQKERVPANGNHLVLVLTPKDAARAVTLRRSQGFAITD